MVFLLGVHNVKSYLVERGLLNQVGQNLLQIEPRSSKNFNLLVHSNHRQFLVKQEPHDQDGNANGDLLNEWRIHQFVQGQSAFHYLQPLLPEVLDCDAKHAILIFNYLKEYCDLDTFYRQAQNFPQVIPTLIGVALAEIHRATFNSTEYSAYTANLDPSEAEALKYTPQFGSELEQLTPEIFSTVATEGLKFYELYQRSQELQTAIAQLNQQFEPCCLTHNDLKLGNILLHNNWKSILLESYPLKKNSSDVAKFTRLDTLILTKSIIRLIDWEKWIWGDPALDVGTVIAEYLKRWLESLIVHRDLDIETALQLAAVPLEQLQPSICAFMQAYLHHFPQVLDRFSNFLQRVMQFTGLALIESIQARLHYYEPFGNVGICKLQVAKMLLCYPEQSISTVFGMSEAAVKHLSKQPLKVQLDPIQAVSSWGRIKPQPATSLSPVVCSRSSDQFVESPVEPSLKLGVEATIKPTIALYDTRLWELVCHIQITADGFMHQTSGSSMKLSDDTENRLQQLSPTFQKKYLSQRLRDFLYDIYFSQEALLGNNSEINFDSINSDSNDYFKVLQNNTLRGVDLTFFEALDQSNCGQGHFDPGWQILSVNECLIVTKDGLTLEVDPNSHLLISEPLSNQSLKFGNQIAIRLPKNRFESGFYVAIGDAGAVSEDELAIEIYLNISAEAAAPLMHHLTQQLNMIGIPFSFKVLLDPSEYGRYDSAILQVARNHFADLRPILHQVYEETKSHFKSAVPLLTKCLAPGMGLAEEPQTEPRNFGIHRCQIIVNALLAADNSPTQRLTAIYQQFSELGIHWQQPYLNPDSEDIYLLESQLP